MVSRQLCVVAVLLLAVSVNSYVVNHKDRKLDQQEVHQWRSGMFSPEDAPAKGSPGNGKSFVKSNIQISFSDKNVDGSGSVSILLIDGEHRSLVGAKYKEKKVYCCNEELLKNKLCGKSQPGELIVQDSSSLPIGPPMQYAKYSEIKEKAKPITIDFNVTDTSMYYLLVANCMASKEENGAVLVNGQDVWMNPFGYLPGELYSLMPFFYTLMWMCIIGLVAYAVAACIYRKDILKLQLAIMLVGVVYLIELFVRYYELKIYNTDGLRPLGLSMFGLFLGVLKNTVSRVLVLVVSLGYGVVRPTLGGDARKVQSLAVFYVFFNVWYNFVEYINTEEPVPDDVMLLVIMPVSMLDAIFYWWIFYALHRTLNQLKVRRQSSKLAMYRKFALTLVGAVVASVVMVLYETFLLATKYEDERWQQDWVLRGCWQILYIVILGCIMVIWRPSKTSSRFAYSEELGFIDSEDEGEEVLVSAASGWGGGNVTLRGKKETDVELGEVDEDEKQVPTTTSGTTISIEGSGKSGSPNAVPTPVATIAASSASAAVPEAWESRQQTLNAEKTKLMASFALDEEDEDLVSKID